MALNQILEDSRVWARAHRRPDAGNAGQHESVV